MNVSQQFDILSGPIVDSDGRAQNNLIQFLLTLWNRTGQAPGVSSADLEVITYLAQTVQGAEKADAARSAADASAALELALTPRPRPRQNDDIALLALLQSIRAPGVTAAALQAANSMKFVQTQAVTVANTVTETTLLGSGVGSLVIPANSLRVGSTMAGFALGPHSATGSPTLQLRVYLNSTVILDTGAVATHSGTNDTWEFRGWITCLSTGVSGTIEAQGFYIESGAGTEVFGMVNTGPITINTTIDQTINFTAQWGTASASNSITARLLDIQGWAPPIP